MSRESMKTPSQKSRKGKGRKSRGGRGLLWLIALCLVGSAILRMGGGTGIAIAQELQALASGSENVPTGCEPDADIAAVLGLLRERETKVAMRESAIEDRAQAVAVAEEQVRKNLTALAQAEQDLKRMISLSSEAAEEDLGRLTMVYENMKPKDATAVFAEMDPEFAAGFLGRMRADAAASIMAGLDPEKAYVISVLLAGRNANAPTE